MLPNNDLDLTLDLLLSGSYLNTNRLQNLKLHPFNMFFGTEVNQINILLN